MCGIIGGFTSIAGGVERLKHRGPDAQNQITVGKVSLGHTRLAIKDLDRRSDQPFHYGNVCLVFNGEIWNYMELREELTRVGYEFRTTGDTEVLAACLNAYGIDETLRKVNGMFAFAYTTNGENVYVARDKFGEIPVHIGIQPSEEFGAHGRFIFASEVKALKAIKVAPPTIDYVLPGEYVEARSNGTIHKTRWYVPPIEPAEKITRGVAAELLYEKLRAAVREREMSDVPLCTMLSGGLDSSLITYLLAQDIPNIVAYTAVHDKSSKDLKMARMLAKQLNIELREVYVPTPTRDELAEVVRIAETPYKVQVEIGWACLKLAEAMKRDGFKVTFSGDGSDELFASYGFSYYGLKKAGWYDYRRDLFLDQHRKNFSRANKVFMSQGIECRLPFLNPNVVEFILSLPQEVAQEGRKRPKAVLEDAFRHKLPDGIVNRTKVAFQDGMKIKGDIESVVADPMKFYRTEYKQFLTE